MKGTSPISVKAKYVEQITVTCPAGKRVDVARYLGKNGWYISRSGPLPIGDGRVDEKQWQAVCVREDAMRSAQELLDEVETDLKKL